MAFGYAVLMSEVITIEVTVKSSLETVWDCWTKPEHITKWNQASDDWHTPHAENDVQVDGKLFLRMEAKDGSMGFDLTATYTEVDPNTLIAYTMDDNRTVRITFTEENDEVHIVESFEAEQENSIEMQREGWQAILNSFKDYCESL